MSTNVANVALTVRLADAFYTEALLLADETRSYFDGPGVAERAALPPHARVAYACESLNSTTRLMHVVAWLLTRRGVEAGRAADDRAAKRLGLVPPAEPAMLAELPHEARRLIASGIDLYERVRRLDHGAAVVEPSRGPARSLMERLERSF